MSTMGVAGSNRRGGGGPRRNARNGRLNGKAARLTAEPFGGAAPALRFEIPSDYEQGHDVQQRILSDVERSGFSSNSLFAVKIALEEALVNAIKHGNRQDPRKKVRVEAQVTPQRVEILVEDEGPGFERCEVPDPTAKENLTKCSGRGILLIESYMNDVRWEHGGRRLRMMRENEPEELPAR
jgi:serine/threonine-protein kinase RsbW